MSIGALLTGSPYRFANLSGEMDPKFESVLPFPLACPFKMGIILRAFGFWDVKSNKGKKPKIYSDFLPWFSCDLFPKNSQIKIDFDLTLILSFYFGLKNSVIFFLGTTSLALPLRLTAAGSGGNNSLMVVSSISLNSLSKVANRRYNGLRMQASR